MKYFFAFLGVATGVAGMVAGEADDSPGLMLIGLVIAVATVAGLLRSSRSVGGAGD